MTRCTTMSLANKTLFITGGSRGIGRAIALRAARDGANVAVVGKTATPNPKLPEKTVEAFGGMDILVNNASAISLTRTLDTDMKRFDLMHQINTRGTFLCSKACLPALSRSSNPHVLMLSPPPALEPKWFAPHVAYTMAKYGMSLCVLGFAEEFKSAGIAVNALWPRTVIATETTGLTGGLNVQQGMAKITSDFGIAVNMVSDNAAFDKNLLSDLTSARESASGVSVDDELIHLTAAQTAYNALTKVITTTSTLLDTLMKII